jgi:hypothetical protein
MAKRRYAPPASKADLFYQFSSEAFLLTFAQYQHPATIRDYIKLLK